MTTPPPTPHKDRKWYGLSLRHLRISARLLSARFPDGSCFHTYHAFECALGAVIVAKGWPVPPEGKTYGPSRMVYYHGPSGQINEPSTHKARLILFEQVANHAMPYYTTYSTLKRYLTNPMRNRTLYYESVPDLLPQQQFNQSQADGLYRQVRQFVKEVRPEIH